MRLRIALGLSVVGAALLVLGPERGVVRAAPPAGFSAMPLLVALALVAPVLAAVAIVVARPVIAAGVLIGSALLAPGRALMDLQFAKDATAVARPELMVPTSLAPLSASIGLWLLVAGHVVIIAAGVLAGGARTEVLDGVGEALPPRRNYLTGWAFGCATAATVGLILPPFHSDDAFVPARDVIDSPTLVRIGGLLVVAGVVLGSLMAASSARPPSLRRTSDRRPSWGETARSSQPRTTNSSARRETRLGLTTTCSERKRTDAPSGSAASRASTS